MAVSLVWPAMNHGPPPSVHPFFTPRPVQSEQENARPPAEDRPATEEPILEPSAPLDVQETVIDAAHAEVGKLNGDLDGTNEEKEAPAATTGSTKPAWPISSKPIEPQSKRRKLHHNGHLPDTEGRDPLVETLTDVPQVIDVEGDIPGAQNGVRIDSMSGSHPSKAASPPRKMLKLSASGKLASPKPRTVAKDKDTSQPAPKKRGRPKRSLIVVCRYSKPESGENATGFGALIKSILSGEHRHTITVTKPRQQPMKLAPSGPAKPTHPFFSGPPKKTMASEVVLEEGDHEVKPANSPHRKSFASTPGKIRLQVAQMKSARVPPLPFDDPRKTARNNTAKSEVWPGPGMQHFRALEGSLLPRTKTYQVSLRKKKLASPTNDVDQSALISVTRSSDASEKRIREDGFADPHPSLRLSRRALMTGLDKLRTVSPNLSPNHLYHPATNGLTMSVLTHMTAYDNGRGESLPWTLKYAPVEASTVLQSSVDAVILRDWMKYLTVNAVGSSLIHAKAPGALAPRKKRRKKVTELDDFLVSSGDEDEQFGALGGLDELGSQGSQGSRTLVRSGPDNTNGEPPKLANAVILSGPHGCGKTAMVLAVAKELDFQVFEINAGSKRSRADILARIGDVVANHIVSHGKTDSGNTSADEDSRISAAFQKDLDSGRQGTMKSFFTSASAKKEAPKAARKQAVVNAANKALKAEPARHQKQSVILLEEVDVLFEEDKAFWEAIISLLATSRRPVVMTCTNDAILPLDALTVHAIIRLTPPPDELAVDYLLLVAAQEGHLLSRVSVEALYRYKRRDLRASLTDLQFWCQMGIGDPRGGLSWIFQRWPPGTGVDADGNVQRVVSEGTHHVNMGCFPCEREELSSDEKHRELLSEAWSDWSLDPRDEIHVRLPESLAALDVDIAVVGNQGRLDALRKMEKLTETLSALDVQCQVGLPTLSSQKSAFAPLGSILTQRMDPTQPAMAAKLRSSFTEYPALLQADESIDFADTDRDITVTTCALLPAALGVSAPRNRLSELIQEERPYAAYEAVSANHLYGALEPLADDMLSGGNYTSLVLPLPTLMTDIAPYVRSIAAHDHQRRSLYADLGGKRKTRAARGAVEGRGRNAVRRERWWDCELDELPVTAGQHTFAAGARIAAQHVAERTLAEDMMEE